MFGTKKTQIITDEKKIDELLSRGVENIFPNRELLKAKLMSGERLTFYYGIDPTGITLHIGHVVQLKKMGVLQKLGHRVILLIGDFTAMIGDPTDKMAARVPLTREKVLENAKLYKEQASHFISFKGNNPAELQYNSKWLAKMPMDEIFKLMSRITYAQTIKRDMFQARIAQGKDLFLHEFLYPMMQGYDSVAMNVDGEIGGNDQTFNMLMGRDLLKSMKGKEKFVIATKLLVDSSGKKMGKTEGNMVSLDQTPEDMFGKVMSWSDGLIIPGFEIVTDIPLVEIASIKSSLENGGNPKDFKVKLAKEIITMIHGSEAADRAEQNFINTFKKGEVPEDALEIVAEHGTHLKDLLVQSKVVASNTEWRRLVEGNAISIVGTDEVITDPYVKIEKAIVVRVGKKRFVKIIIK